MKNDDKREDFDAGSTPGVGVVTEPNLKEKIRISMLVTSIYYFLDFVFIISDGNCFHLVVIHNDQLLTYNTYDTVKGAKIAFSRLYGYKVWNEDIKPGWSSFYFPTAEWLNERWDVIQKGAAPPPSVPGSFNRSSSTG